MTETKYRPLHVKTVPTDGSGVFTGLASTYGGDPDHQGDVVERGAFAESILRWRALGDYPPILFNHSLESANARIGKIISMQEIDEGLLITAMLNLKNKRALEVYEALLDGSLDQLSIGYATITQYKRDDGKGGQFNVLSKLDLIEVSIVAVPANPRARVLDVKARTTASPTDTDSKKAEATRVLRVVFDWMDAKQMHVHGLFNDTMRAARETVADRDADVQDVHDAVTNVVGRYATLKRYAEEDAEVSAKWATYAVKQQLDDLQADLAVGGEKAVRHQSPNEDDVIDMRRHLSRSHANQINSVADVERMQVDELVAAHRTMHALSSKAVDGLIADVKAEKAADDEARQKFEQANANLLNGPIDWTAQDAYDRRRSEQERQELERKWTERRLLADRKEAAEKIARSQAMTPMGAFWSDTPVQTVDDGPRELLTPRITDATVSDEGSTFRMPISGTPDPTPLRVEPDDAIREVAPEGGERYRVLPFAVTDTPTAVPQNQESFSIPLIVREDSQLVEQEKPLTTEPKTIGETFRMPTGGSVTESIDAMEDGEKLS